MTRFIVAYVDESLHLHQEVLDTEEDVEDFIGRGPASDCKAFIFEVEASSPVTIRVLNRT